MPRMHASARRDGARSLTRHGLYVSGQIIPRVAACIALALTLLGTLRPLSAAEPPKRLHYQFLMPSLRVGLGASLMPTRNALAGDLTAGVQFVFEGPARRAALFLQPSAGYFGTGPSEGRLHAFQLEMGVGVGDRRIRGMLRPRLLLGQRTGAPLVGLRTGLALEVLMGGLGLEVDHMLIGNGGQSSQGVGLMVTTDLVPLALLALRTWWQ